MKLEKVYLLLMLCLCLTLGDSLAQINNSVYTMFGIGYVENNGIGRSRSMGGTGIAMKSAETINFTNPASLIGLSDFPLTYEFGVFGNYTNSQKENLSQSNFDINFDYFGLGIPLLDWWAFSLGVVPYSSISYKVTASDEVEGELTRFDKTYEGSGGINQIFFGNAIEIFDDFSIGLNAKYYFGPLTLTETSIDEDQLTTYSVESKNSVFGLNFELGLQYALNYKGLDYVFGFVYSHSKNLKSMNEITITLDSESTALEKEENRYKLPSKLGFGLAVRQGKTFIAGIDYVTERWSGIEFANQALSINNSDRFSAGVEYFPGKGRLDEGFESLYYRAGINYYRSYLSISGERIDSKAISAGIGIPYNNGKSVINLSLEYGTRGTLNKGLIKENYLMFFVNLALHEFWFVSKDY